MIWARTKSVDDTRALAAEMSSLARAGDLILLSGEVGSGKTVFAQGVGRALGITEPITSPTFIIVRRYENTLPLLHIDVYRLDHMQEVVELGVAELIDDDAVALVEWGDVVAPALPADFLEVRLEFGEDDDERLIAIESVGPAWAPRLRALRSALERWLVR